MKNICIITHSHMCRNPRVVKEARILNEAGYRVSILTVWSDEKLLAEDQELLNTAKINYIPAVNIIKGEGSFWGRFKTRLIRKIAGQLVSFAGIETIQSVGYGYKSTLKKALKQDADLYICHQELPTIIGCKLIQKGHKVAFDFEDWYSHDLLPDANRSRPIRLLKKYEKFALQEGVLNYTTSRALSDGLSKFANTKEPKVIYNSFPFNDRLYIDEQQKDRIKKNRVSLFWFSQTMGPGRGLEELAEALNRINDPFELHLRGNILPGYDVELMQLFHLKNDQEVRFHALVPHNELLSRIAEHDIGLALEKKTPPSRDLTITNKILQYLLGGLAVVASDTSGQKEVESIATKSVFTFSDRSVDQLTEHINMLIQNKDALEEAKYQALAYAKSHFSTELESEKLCSFINQVFEK